MKEKCIVLFSNGLDSRLAIKIMQKRKFNVVAVFFRLPFSKNAEKEVQQFCKSEKVRLKIFDCTKGKLFGEYLASVKKIKYSRGAGFNPCADCKIFMLWKTKKFADKRKINFIVTGEVFGQRPMSQTQKWIKVIEKDSGLAGRLVRPVSEIAVGRKRDAQIRLAKEFKISYPTPAGGCLLCEKNLKDRFKLLINCNLINSQTLPLANVGRHFFIKNCWFVVGRNEKENEIIERFKDNFVRSKKGKPAVYFDKKKERKFAEKLQEDYKTGGIKKCASFKL